MKKREVKKNKNLKIIKFSKRKKSKKMRLMIKRFFILVSFFAIAAILFFGVSLILTRIFSIRHISVKGDTRYSSEDIIKHSGIGSGSSLIFTDVNASEEKIYKSFPYIEEVKVTKKFPDSVVISTQGAAPQYSLYLDGEYLVVSEKDKLLEKSAELPPELINIIGVKFSFSETGKIIYENENIKKLFSDIIKDFKSKGLNNIKKVDVSDINNIILNYDNRLKIEVGTSEDAVYKALTAKEIITNKISSSEKGTLDLKNLKKENRSYFTPEV